MSHVEVQIGSSPFAAASSLAYSSSLHAPRSCQAKRSRLLKPHSAMRGLSSSAAELFPTQEAVVRHSTKPTDRERYLHDAEPRGGLLELQASQSWG